MQLMVLYGRPTELGKSRMTEESEMTEQQATGVTEPAQPPAALIRQLVMDMRASRALYAAAELGIADHLAIGPKSSAQLAQLHAP
jgi:hypothetical protein